jgi:hypothetical protein
MLKYNTLFWPVCVLACNSCSTEKPISSTPYVTAVFLATGERGLQGEKYPARGDKTFSILYFSILLHSFNTEYFSGGEYSITTEDGRVRPKHVLIEFKKWMCYIDGQKNKY